MKSRWQGNCLSAVAWGMPAMQRESDGSEVIKWWPRVQVTSRHILCVAVAICPLVLSYQAKAVEADQAKNLQEVVVTDQGPSDGLGPGGGLWWGSFDNGGSIGIGGNGGGSSHTSSNKSSTANQNNSKSPKSKCNTGATQSATTGSSDPIDTSTGSKIEKVTDFAERGEMGLTFERYYNSRYDCSGSTACYSSFGTWTTNLDYKLNILCIEKTTAPARLNGRGVTPNQLPGGGEPIPCSPVGYQRPDGSILRFSSSPASYGGPGSGSPQVGPFIGVGTATLINNGNGTYTVHDEDGKALTFNGVGNLLSIKDASGIGWTLTHPDANTTIVTHTSGAFYKIAVVSGPLDTYGAAKQINVTDPAGNVYVYHSVGSGIDSSSDSVSHLGVIQSEVLPGSPTTTSGYKYLPDTASSSAQLSEVDYNGVAHDITTYDSAGRANMSSMADGTQKTTIVYGTNSTGLTATMTNPLGHVSVYQYDSNQLLVSVTGDASSLCAASFANNTYDTNGNLLTSTDNNGNITKYVYAANGLLQQKIEAAGTAVQRTTDFTWDTTPGTDRPLSIKVEGLSEADFTYDSHNRLASRTVKNLSAVGTAQQALTTTYAYTYAANGLLQTRSVIHPSPGGSNTDVYAYDAVGNLASVADGLGHTTTYTSYTLLGAPGQVSGPNGDVTNYSYDARGRVVSKTTYPYGTAGSWTYTYDGFGLPASVTTPDSSVASITRNADMQVTSITRNDKDGTSIESFAYDANGDLITHTVARGSDIGVEETTTYDQLGRVYQQHGMHGQVLTYAYDVNDNVVSVTDALGHATTYQYDALNRVARSTDPNGGVTSYAYDLANHVVTVTDSRDLVTTYAYDGLGQLWQQVSPDTGTTTYAYDTYGRRAGMTRADGTVTSYSYDSINRLRTVTASGATQTFAYDNCTDGLGRLCSDSDATGVTSYTYTPEGWVSGRGFSIGGTTYALGYNYDGEGRLAAVAYPDGNRAVYYRTHGAVNSVQLVVGGADYWGASAVTYRPADMVMASWTSSNGLINTLAYDTDGRLTSIAVPGIQSLTFGYDADNRITYIGNGIDGSMTETVGYDAMSRITSMSSGAQSESYRYDMDGNRLSAVVNGSSETFTPDVNSNRLISSYNPNFGTVTSGFDPQGNTTTTNGLVSQQYDPFNRLLNSGGATFYINPEGQRLRKAGGSTGTTYFAPDAGGVLMAENDNGTWVDYVRVNGRLIGRISSGQIDAIHTDQVGRPDTVTDASQNVVWHAKNYPFGSTVTLANITLNLGFPGQYYDAETSLWNNGYRDYNSGSGRYIESDPTGLAGGINTYAYVGGNPLSYTDPYGLANLLLGGNVNAIVVGGFTLSGGIYVSWGQGFDIGVYGSVGGGVGVDLGAGVSAGYVRGSSSNIAGQTLDLQGSIGPVTGSGSVAITSNGCKSYGSGSIGAGLGLPLGGALTSTFTNTFGLSNIMSLIHGH